MGDSLRTLKGVGEKTEKLFQKIGIYNTEDLIHYYPRNYETFETPANIADLKEGTVKSVSAAVCTGVYISPGRGKQIITTTIADHSGKLSVIWFNMPYLRAQLKKGSTFVFRGKIIRKQNRLQMEHPEIFTPAAYEEILHSLQPVYFRSFKQNHNKNGSAAAEGSSHASGISSPGNPGTVSAGRY